MKLITLLFVSPYITINTKFLSKTTFIQNMFIIYKYYTSRLMDNKTKKMTYKDKLAVWTASISFFLGWALVVINFFIDPVGAIADSSLWILGQALLYCGGVIGIAQYAKTEITKIKHHVGMTTDEDYEE